MKTLQNYIKSNFNKVIQIVYDNPSNRFNYTDCVLDNECATTLSQIKEWKLVPPSSEGKRVKEIIQDNFTYPNMDFLKGYETDNISNKDAEYLINVYQGNLPNGDTIYLGDYSKLKPSAKMLKSIKDIEDKYGEFDIKEFGIEMYDDNRVGNGFFDYCVLRSKYVRMSWIVSHNGSYVRQ